MGQKINPISLRLQYTNRNFDNCWYSGYFYQNLITRDIFLQQYLNSFLKLLKLDAGRYSIQHLQKNTQIYNFLCYSKSTREWRSKIFGLVRKKNSLKKARYFFKNSTKGKKNKKGVNLSYFYSSLNQIAVQRIKKKITSFQNLKLWSTLLKKKPQETILLSLINKSKNYCNTTYQSKTFARFEVNSVTKTVLAETQFHKNLISLPFKEKSEWIKKVNSSTSKAKKFSKNNTLPLISRFSKESQFFLEKPLLNTNRVFLQNLIVYKILKSQSFLQKKDGKKDVKIQNTTLNLLHLVGLNYKYKNYLEYSLSTLNKIPINLINFKVKNDWQNASYLADEIVYFLEKRVSFRAIKAKILKQLLKNTQIRGIRITCSGRVGGKSKKAQRAKTECIKYGQTSLQVFSSKLDFAVKTAFTSFGSVGVKVWVCYN